MIANVVAGRADIVFLAAGAAAGYEAANPGKIERAFSRPVRVFPDAIMLPQGSYEFRQALNYALEEMLNDGTVERILKRYEQAPGTFLRVAPPYSEAQTGQ
jgi:ABC-type amino acid transport substrate-binding protein